MLYRSLFRRALALHLTTNSVRSFSGYASAMASPPQSFTLDKSIFNESLYSHVRNFWFAGLPEGASAPNSEIVKRWYGGVSQEQKKFFDNECHENFGYALRALAPEDLALPAFESYEKDLENAEEISRPLLTELNRIQSQDSKMASDTLLSLILLLDQISRNIYRDPESLGLVFNHYDRLAFTLLRSSMRLTPSPMDHESLRLRPVIRSWYLMPLMHSEHLPSHELFYEIVRKAKKDLEAAQDEPAVEYLATSLKFEDKHFEPLKRFGRYPHRNDALGRKTTEEEKEFMNGAETFGIQQGGKADREKSEL